MQKECKKGFWPNMALKWDKTKQLVLELGEKARASGREKKRKREEKKKKKKKKRKTRYEILYGTC